MEEKNDPKWGDRVKVNEIGSTYMNRIGISGVITGVGIGTYTVRLSGDHCDTYIPKGWVDLDTDRINKAHMIADEIESTLSPKEIKDFYKKRLSTLAERLIKKIDESGIPKELIGF